MKDEMKKTDAMHSSEVQEDELTQATGGAVYLLGEKAVLCPKCGTYELVVKSTNPRFKYLCRHCNKYFNFR